MRPELRLATFAAALLCLTGCGYVATVAGSLGGTGTGALGGIFGGGAAPGGPAGGGGIPAFVNQFQQTTIAQPGIHPGTGGTGP